MYSPSLPAPSPLTTRSGGVYLIQLGSPFNGGGVGTFTVSQSGAPTGGCAPVDDGSTTTDFDDEEIAIRRKRNAPGITEAGGDRFHGLRLCMRRKCQTHGNRATKSAQMTHAHLVCS